MLALVSLCICAQLAQDPDQAEEGEEEALEDDPPEKEQASSRFCLRLREVSEGRESLRRRRSLIVPSRMITRSSRQMVALSAAQFSCW